MFRELIEDLKKIFLKLPKSTNESAFLKPIYISIIIFYFLMILDSIVLSVFFHSEERIFSLKPIYFFIAELHLEVIHFSTDFYVLYFTSYLIILQKLFKSELKEYNNQE